MTAGFTPPVPRPVNGRPLVMCTGRPPPTGFCSTIKLETKINGGLVFHRFDTKGLHSLDPWKHDVLCSSILLKSRTYFVRPPGLDPDLKTSPERNK